MAMFVRHAVRVVLGAAAVLGLTAAMATRSAAEEPRERGSYLVTSIAGCGNCHSPKDKDGHAIAGQELSGGFEFDIPPGRAIASNITSDPETGIGKWSEAQIVTALHNGKRPDGTTIGPPMPMEFYRQISDADALAIAAHLKTVPPVKHAVAKSQYKIPLPASYGPPVEQVAAPLRSDKIAYGGYLAGPIGHCLDCHTPFAGPGKLDMNRLGAGGREFPVFAQPGALTVSRNITPDPDSGIGKWSDADIKRAITVGVRPDGTKLVRTMAFDWYSHIAPEDLDALVAYLRSMKPVK